MLYHFLMTHSGKKGGRFGMKKIIQIMLLAAFIISFVPVAIKSNAAKENMSDNVLAPYIEHLQEFNQEFGTDYAIPDEATCNETGTNYHEIVRFYTAMTLEEFDAYIRDLYEQYGTAVNTNYAIVDGKDLNEFQRSLAEILDEENTKKTKETPVDNMNQGFHFTPWTVREEKYIYIRP